MGTVTPPNTDPTVVDDYGEYTPTGLCAQLFSLSKTHSKEYANEKIDRDREVLDEMRSLCNEEQLDHIDSIIYFICCARELINEETKV